ncbi:MAG TPA: peptide-methionine (S)-S-oxide reductase MsrA [Vicinamibacterales bacterium]|jgi:peptide-methionine (S)-S-oxide reductase
MSAQRPVWLGAIVVSLAYAWLRGGFVFAGAPSEVPTMQPGWQKATFAVGCFWTAESDFDKVDGVRATTAGFIGGHVANPTYDQVVRGGTGHVEAVEVLFDPAIVTYDRLLDYFWHHVDPFVSHRQFCDVGQQYRPVIFVNSAVQREAAEASRARMQARFRQEIKVAITDASPFFPADESHQDYYKKHPVQYQYYRWACGRDARLESIWGNVS